MGRDTLTHEALVRRIIYDPDTGYFYNRKSGKRLGWFNGNYLRLYIGRTKYYLHRLAWFYVTGSWPADEIDHINGDKLDNRFANLREATRSQNRHNTPVRRDSRSGVKGAEFVKKLGKYRAVISIEGVKHRLGYFDTAEEAGQVYADMARHWQKEYAHDC